MIDLPNENDSNMTQKGNIDIVATFSDGLNFFRQNFLYATSARVLFLTHFVDNVNYCLLTHRDISYRFNGKKR